MPGARAQGFVNNFVVFVAAVLVVVAIVRHDVLSCAPTQGLVVVAVVLRNLLSCACARGLVDITIARRDVSTACAIPHVAFAE
jgi:hypothetical protein